MLVKATEVLLTEYISEKRYMNQYAECPLSVPYNYKTFVEIIDAITCDICM